VFVCRESDISDYFNGHLRKDIGRFVTAGYALYDNDALVGFFTLSQHSIKREKQRDKGHFSDIPATLLGQFAIADDFCGKDYQNVRYSRILLDMVLNIHIKIAKEIGSTALMLNPINNTVREKFYKKLGIFSDYQAVDKKHDYLFAKTKDIIAFLSSSPINKDVY
jgi:hypothetical protein